MMGVSDLNWYLLKLFFRGIEGCGECEKSGCIRHGERVTANFLSEGDTRTLAERKKSRKSDEKGLNGG